MSFGVKIRNVSVMTTFVADPGRGKIVKLAQFQL